MTRFVSTRYPQLRIPALRVRFRDGYAEVSDPAVAERLAAWPIPGVDLAPGEGLPGADGGDEGPDSGAEPRRPAKTARREDWQSYILATYDVDRSEIADMTKAQLQELAEGSE